VSSVRVEEPASRSARRPPRGSPHRYLRGFEWRHLTEKQAYDRRVKADRLRVEFAQSQRDASEYLGLVDQRDKVNAIKKRKRKRADDKDKG